MKNKQTNAYINVLKECFLFQNFTEKEIKKFLEQAGQPHCLKKGEAVYASTDFQKALALVLQGELRVTCQAGNQKHAILNLLQKGDVCGATALYGGGETFVTDVTVTKDAIVLFISQEYLSRCFQETPKMAENYIRFLTDRIRFLNGKISTYTGGQSEDRLYRFLSEHCGENGLVSFEGSASDLARILDIGRSSLYRSLELLETTGKIRREGRKIYLLSQ